MARSYRRVALAEEKLLTAKGILDNVDTRVTASSWFAVGYVRGLVDDAIACLACNPSAASVEAYTVGVDAMEGYVQRALFGEGSDGDE